MGFFDSVVNTVRNVVERPGDVIKQAGNISRGLTGSAGYLNSFTAPFQLGADYNNQQDNIARASAEADAAKARMDQSISAADRVRAQQGLYAAELKKNAARDYGLLSNQAAANERRAMAESIRNAKTGAASRGLIGSGFQKSQEAGARASAAANTASKQKQIQEMTQQQIQDAEDLQAQLGLEMGGIQQNMADQYYQMAIQNMAKRNQSYADILSAGARVGGTYLGNRSAS